MKDSAKIKKYANGLIKVTGSKYIVDTVDSLVSFKHILKEFPQLRHLLQTKRVSIEHKIKSVRNIFGKFYNDISIEFLVLIINNNDLSIYNDILDKLITLSETNSSAKKVSVISHRQFSMEDQTNLEAVIKKRYNISDSCDTSFQVDSKILGGIKVRIGNKIIDGSVLTKLKKIKQSLLSI